MSEAGSIKNIFNDALILSPRERDEFLDRVCGSDGALRGCVEQLLEAHQSANEFLCAATDGGLSPVPDISPSDHTRYSDRSALLHNGDALASPSIDRYRLLRRIGEGGFGAVYLARQEAPVVREVAVKIIKAGMDTRQVIRRFESERQMLAVMDHPCIARILDGGATPEGRPYFVMEYVPGRSITEYCREQRLGSRPRLELFIEVCNAVQHAHQKGVIHRDLKPSNVLVATVDGRATPRIIDFGIAKAVAGQPADATQLTEQQQPVGTPAYMSPEQAGLSAGDIDTRSDIYSLGVLLYELLTGQTPFDTELLRGSGLAEFQRIVREVDPPRPSARVAKSAARELRGDLDWIVMKCLEKDRARRYEAANALAADVRRHVAGEAVLAAPPGAGYRLRKFLRRNRLFVAVGGLVAAGVVLGIGGVVAGWMQANASAARAKETFEFLANMLPNPLNFAAQTDRISPPSFGADSKLSAVLDDAAAWLQTKQFSEREVEATVKLTLGAAYWGVGRYVDAERFAREAHQLRKGLFGADDERTLEAMFVLQETVRMQVQGGPQAAKAVELGRELWAGYRQLFGEGDSRTLHARSALFFAMTGDADSAAEAREFGDETIRLLSEHLGRDAFRTNLTQHFMVGLLVSDPSACDRAEQLALKTVELSLARGEDDFCVLGGKRLLGYIAYLRGDLDAAARYSRESMEGFERVVGRAHRFTVDSMCDLGFYLSIRGSAAEAESVLVEGIKLSRQIRPEPNRDLFDSLGGLGIALQALGRHDEALTHFEEVDRSIREQPERFGPPRREIRLGHVNCLVSLQRYSDAEREMLTDHAALSALPAPDRNALARVTETLVRLYDDWDAAQPGQGHAEQKADWEARRVPDVESDPAPKD